VKVNQDVLGDASLELHKTGGGKKDGEHSNMKLRRERSRCRGKWASEGGWGEGKKLGQPASFIKNPNT